MLRYSFAALFMGRPMFLLTFPGEKKRMEHGVRKLVELLQKTVL